MASYIMQARSSTSGELVGWTVDDAPDWTGESFPGPGSPEDIAAIAPGSGGNGGAVTTGGEVVYTGSTDGSVLTVCGIFSLADYADGSYFWELRAVGDAGGDPNTENSASAIVIRRSYVAVVRSGDYSSNFNSDSTDGADGGVLDLKMVIPAGVDPTDADAFLRVGEPEVEVCAYGQSSTKIDWKIYVKVRSVLAASGGGGWGEG